MHVFGVVWNAEILDISTFFWIHIEPGVELVRGMRVYWPGSLVEGVLLCGVMCEGRQAV
jgi:hypothetical protein